MPGKYDGYDLGCLMVDYKMKNWRQLIGKIVQPGDIYPEEGYEDDAHVTALYGFHDGAVDIEKLKQIVPPRKELTAHLDKIDIFELEDSDVVKFNVVSPGLVKLNKLLRDNFEHTLTHPKYEPHMTIAYVKKGLGKKYIRDLSKDIHITPVWYRYTGPVKGIYYF